VKWLATWHRPIRSDETLAVSHRDVDHPTEAVRQKQTKLALNDCNMFNLTYATPGTAMI